MSKDFRNRKKEGCEKNMFKFNLQHFAAGEAVHTTSGIAANSTGSITPYGESGGLSAEMKTYYSDYLIDMAEPKLVHDQFGQKQPIPKGKGKTIEFRKYDPLPKMTTPLAEGVTPNGQKMDMGVITAEVKQYGGFIELSDILMLTAIDNNLVQATKLLGGQAGRTLDSITREVLCGGTNVQFAEGQVTSRSLLTGGNEEGNHYLSVDAVRRAVCYLKKMNAETINGSYVGIIHPDTAYDLMSDPKWINVKTYSDPEGIYQGEIGKIENVRFVESSEAKVFHAEDLCSESRTLTVASYTTLSSAGTASAGFGEGTLYKLTVEETLTETDAERLFGAMLQIESADGIELLTVSGVDYSGKVLYLDFAPVYTPSEGDAVYPGEAGYKGCDVYATLIIGDNAYGTTEISGGGLQHIVKQLGSAGTADPLDQRSTAGWKATKAAVRLVEPYMVRIETASTFGN